MGFVLNEGSMVTDDYAMAVFAAAKLTAQKLDMDLPRVLVIAEWEGLSTTCCDITAGSSELEHLLGIGRKNLIGRGLLVPGDN